MMKRILTYFIFLMFVMTATAATTTDKVTLSASNKLIPGGDAIEVTVSLVGGEHIYTGYNMDIVLPEGFSVLYNDGERGYCAPNWRLYTRWHNVQSNMVTLEGKPALRVSCFSSYNDNLYESEGVLFTFMLKAPVFTKPGAVEIGLVDTQFAVYENSAVTPYTVVNSVSTDIEASTQAIAPLSVSATAKWGTAMLPFTAQLPDGVKAYSCNSSNENNLILQPVSQIKAFTPYILYSENGFSDNLSGTVSAQDYPEADIVTEGYLSASITRQVLTEGYVMQKQNNEVQFYKVNSEKPVTVQAGKCWAVIPASLAKNSFGFIVDDVTCVTPLSVETKDNSPFHTINGMDVAPIQRGIYIHQGKKYIKQR